MKNILFKFFGPWHQQAILKLSFKLTVKYSAKSKTGTKTQCLLQSKKKLAMHLYKTGSVSGIEVTEMVLLAIK